MKKYIIYALMLIAASASAQFSSPSSGGAALPTQTGQGGKYLQTDGTATSWQTVAGGSATLTRNYTTSQAVAVNDILELQPSGTVRKAAQLTQTTGIVYNNQTIPTTIQGVYNYQINATTFGTLTTDGITYTTRTTTYNAGAGTFSAGTIQANNAPLPNVGSSVNTTSAWRGTLVGSGPRMLFALPTTGTMLFWVLNKSTGVLSGGGTAGTPQGGVSYDVSAFESDNADRFGVWIWHNNGQSMYSAIVIDISSGAGTNVTSSSNNPTSDNLVPYYVANTNRVVTCPAGGTQRFGFMATNPGVSGVARLHAMAPSASSNAQPAGTVNITSTFFPSGLQIIGQNGNDVFVCLNQSSGTSSIYRWTCTNSAGGNWSGPLSTFTPTGGFARQCVQLASNKFMSISAPTTTAINSIYADVYNLNPSTGAITLANSQTYSHSGVSGEKEAVNNANVVQDGNGNGIFGIGSYGDQGHIVGFADAFIGTLNTNPIGFATTAAANGATCTVSLNGHIVSGFTGLTPGATQRQSPTTGNREETGTGRVLGVALSTTEIQQQIIRQ
ncbi:MAG: hypothetical protein ACRCVX_14175 [Shewanella sp.]